MAPCTLPFREALNDSICSGRFVDTKIILFTRRDSSGAITKPKALYANSHVLKSVPYFDELLSGEYLESEPKDFSEPIDEDEQAEDYGHYSDSDLEDEDDIVNAKGKAVKKAVPPKSSSLDPLRLPAHDKKITPLYGEWTESSGKGPIIKIRDIAFITFQAFLMYLYTGQIQFAPYGSEENRRSRSAEIVSTSEDLIPRPSPKSIYRLAHMYDIPVLQRLALDGIKNGLERCDIVEEAFSEFSSKYEAVRTTTVDHLALALACADEDSAKSLSEKIDEKIDCFANGDLDHAEDAIAQLWKLSKANGRPPLAPLDELPPVEPTPSPENRMRVQTALIKSIRKGVFFDRKYWTRDSKTSNGLRPIYISSIVAGEKMRHINGLLKMHPGGECHDIGEGSEDSDYESTPEPASASSSATQVDEKEENKPETLPVLTVGSFASWRSLFFYMCTDVIQFALLKSQGIDARARHVQNQTIPGKPPPCSPKSIYSLATALEIEALRDVAFDNIRLKVTGANVVTELFSGHTSRQPDIATMECELLYDKFNDDTTTAQGIEFIGSMPGGNSAHCAGALKLGLKRGLLGGVFLHCPRSECDLPKNTSCRSLGLTCPRKHPKAVYLECSGCGTARAGSESPSCQGCKKKFR